MWDPADLHLTDWGELDEVGVLERDHSVHAS
jgi:hypothetical protein